MADLQESSTTEGNRRPPQRQVAGAVPGSSGCWRLRVSGDTRAPGTGQWGQEVCPLPARWPTESPPTPRPSQVLVSLPAPAPGAPTAPTAPPPPRNTAPQGTASGSGPGGPEADNHEETT